MHVTLHLTNDCNLQCRYCYVRQGKQFMSREVARAAVDFAASAGSRCGVVFFGGEPLLCKERIMDTVAYGRALQDQGKGPFFYKMTTNGTLMDDDFLQYAEENEIYIALSHDGVRAAQDRNRVYADGRGTFSALEERAKALLRLQPYAPVMMTVSPNTVQHYAEGVDYLYGLGFRYLICSLDYAGAWTDKLLEELQRQYLRLAKWYRRMTLQEEKFYLSPFEVKISSHIHGSSYHEERCELGKKQLSVAPDGKLYPCVQFVGDGAYCIGDVFSGVDEDKRLSLYRINEREKEECAGCAIRDRCNHHCACLNRQVTGDLRKVAPSLCAHERILLPIADLVAETLYKKRSAIFIQKQYNDMYPLLSLAEDKLLPR